jgi:hypothetical protein
MSPASIGPRAGRQALCAGLLLTLLAVAGAGPRPSAAPAQGDDAKGRAEATARLQRLTLAFWSFYEDYGELPPAALVSQGGKRLLSWRVLLLPYLGEEKLFREFKLTEPWDSPHNKRLLARMPKVYAPVRGGVGEPHRTLWQVFTGPGTVFEGDRGCRVNQITDGTSNTLLVVEAARAVPWTSPEDLPYHPNGPPPKLGAMFPGVFLFATVDGAVHRGRRNFDPQTLRLAITRADGQVLDFAAGLLPKD